MATNESVEAWERLVRFYRSTTQAMDRHLRESTGRSLDDYDVLHQIALHDGPMRMGALAEALVVANSSCNRIAQRLVDDGLIRRTSGTADRRQVLVELTPDGRRQYRRMAILHTRDIQRLGVTEIDGRVSIPADPERGEPA